jgi:hypothetical protein
LILAMNTSNTLLAVVPVDRGDGRLLDFPNSLRW